MHSPPHLEKIPGRLFKIFYKLSINNTTGGKLEGLVRVMNQGQTEEGVKKVVKSCKKQQSRVPYALGNLSQ